MRKLIFLLIVLLVTTGCPAADTAPETGQAGASEPDAAGEPAIAVKEPVSLLISCAGDVMVHKSQITAQYDSVTGVYDFSNNFRYIRAYIEESDMALFNLETTFGGKPYTGYPVFSAPDELAAALRSAGFCVAITANNHMLDRGVSGLRRTVALLRENGFLVAGSRDNEQELRFAMAEVKGVRIAVIAFTYASGTVPGGLLLNGSQTSGEAENLINYFRYEHIDEDMERIKEIAAEARNAGADIVIVYYHWGNEYQLTSNESQRYIAEKTVKDIGADMVFASHPHTPQEMDLIECGAAGRRAPVFYSMGNFISNQRVETLDAPNNRYTEIGLIARVKLEFDMENREITSLAADAVPVWVDKYKSGGRDIYTIIPLDGSLEQNETLAASGHLGRARKALEDANGILGID